MAVSLLVYEIVNHNDDNANGNKFSFSSRLPIVACVTNRSSRFHAILRPWRRIETIETKYLCGNIAWLATVLRQVVLSERDFLKIIFVCVRGVLIAKDQATDRLQLRQIKTHKPLIDVNILTFFVGVEDEFIFLGSTC